jgi:hypothetical protein
MILDSVPTTLRVYSSSQARCKELLFLFISSGGSSFGLLFYEQGDMLFAEAESTSTWQKLSICCRFATAIAASDMRFYGFHTRK